MKVNLKVFNSKIRTEIIQFLIERYFTCLIAIDYSLSEIARGTGCSKGALVYALRELEGVNVIHRSKKKGRLNIRLNPAHALISRVIEAELLGEETMSMGVKKIIQTKVIQMEKEFQECHRRMKQLETEVNVLQSGIKQETLSEFVKGLAEQIVEEVHIGGFAQPKALEEFVTDMLMAALMDKFGAFLGDL